jgi:RNA polymerase sigma-70 factor (ECF subfamily)
MQESFLKAFTKLDSFSEQVTFGAWLKKIVINQSLTALKKNNRLATVSLEKIVIKEVTEEHEDYSEISPVEILKKMTELKSNYKIALTLNLIEGYDYEEIAQIMELSNENCRTTIFRAKQKLRTLLAEKNER